MRVPALAALLAVAACDNGASQPVARPPADAAEQTPAPPPETPEAPPAGGVPAMQKTVDGVHKALDAFAATEEIGPNEKRELGHQIALIDQLLVAADRAIRAEAELAVHSAYAKKRSEFGDLQKTRIQHFDEIREVKVILTEFEKGIGKIPAGFTEAELRDRISDHREDIRKLDEREEKLRGEMAELEAILNGKAELPSPGESAWTREREALQRLRERAEELRSR